MRFYQLRTESLSDLAEGVLYASFQNDSAEAIFVRRQNVKQEFFGADITVKQEFTILLHRHERRFAAWIRKNFRNFPTKF